MINGLQSLRESKNIFTGQNQPAKNLIATPYAPDNYYENNILPKLKEIYRFCKSNKFVPQEIKNASVKYLKKEAAFYIKWDSIDTTIPMCPENKKIDVAEYKASVKEFCSEFKSWAQDFLKNKKTGDFPKDTPLSVIIQLNELMLTANKISQ